MTKKWKKINVPSNLKDLESNTDFVCLEECDNYNIVGGKPIITEEAKVYI